MARYFTREEAEALLPKISGVLRTIQEGRQHLRGRGGARPRAAVGAGLAAQL